MIWHSAPLSNVIEELKTDPERGLPTGEAENRLREFGPNRLHEKKKKSFWKRFSEQLKDFMVIILIIAAAISLVTTILNRGEDWIEPIVIVAIVILNALLGVFQESKAEAALEALKNMAAPSAKVRRDGIVKVIPADQLVPGDLLLLEAGDYIPADARLIEAASLHCEESALTGESVPVEKLLKEGIPDIAGVGDRINMVYAGCAVSYGRGEAVVTETGMRTEMGKIAAIIEDTDQNVTPLKIKLAQLGKTLGFLALIICFVIFVVGLVQVFIQGGSWVERIVELFMTAISLAVAAIPEGLPAIVTVVLALGVQRMVKKNAIIRNLPAVETLGSASVICSDKTGTLTQNRMTLTTVYDGRQIIQLKKGQLSEQVQMLLKLGGMCSDGRVDVKDGKAVHIGDPTETGIVAACMKYLGLDKSELDNIFPRLGEIPFDSDRKLMTTINMINGRPFAVCKGAPDILLSRCNQDGKHALEANKKMAADALRVLAVAIKPLDDVPANPTSEELERDLNFVGLVGMIDPPRPEVADAIKLCRSAGIRTIMITGDHVVTASAIAKQMGILRPGTRAITGEELRQMDDAALNRNVEKISVYARVSPEDKIRIVKAWQYQGHVVAMTGDGVNDAPALKAADIGCAMGITGTDVAKGAADMTLTDDNFSTIVTAVKEGRGIYDNIKKAVHFLLSCNLGEVLAVFVAMLVWGVSPLLPVQLLWVNLVTDGAPALALGVEPVERDVMERKPRRKDESIFAGGLGINALWQGIMFGVITLIAYGLGLHYGGADHSYANTMAFATLAFSQIIHAWNVRSRHSLFRTRINPWMLLATAFSIGLTLLALLTPMRTIFGLAVLNATEWGEIILLSLVPLVLGEVVKLVTWIVHLFRKKPAVTEESIPTREPLDAEIVTINLRPRREAQVYRTNPTQKDREAHTADQADTPVPENGEADRTDAAVMETQAAPSAEEGGDAPTGEPAIDAAAQREPAEETATEAAPTAVPEREDEALSRSAASGPPAPLSQAEPEPAPVSSDAEEAHPPVSDRPHTDAAGGDKASPAPAGEEASPAEDDPSPAGDNPSSAGEAVSSDHKE